MSVLIKGIKMPKNCAECLLKASCVMRVYMESRPWSCPLMELPPHGRLIIEDGELVNE